MSRKREVHHWFSCRCSCTFFTGNIHRNIVLSVVHLCFFRGQNFLPIFKNCQLMFAVVYIHISTIIVDRGTKGRNYLRHLRLNNVTFIVQPLLSGSASILCTRMYHFYWRMVSACPACSCFLFGKLRLCVAYPSCRWFLLYVLFYLS